MFFGLEVCGDFSQVNGWRGCCRESGRLRGAGLTEGIVWEGRCVCVCVRREILDPCMLA